MGLLDSVSRPGPPAGGGLASLEGAHFKIPATGETPGMGRRMRTWSVGRLDNAVRHSPRAHANVHHPDCDARVSLCAFENAANVPASAVLSTRGWTEAVLAGTDSEVDRTGGSFWADARSATRQTELQP